MMGLTHSHSWGLDGNSKKAAVSGPDRRDENKRSESGLLKSSGNKRQRTGATRKDKNKPCRKSVAARDAHRQLGHFVRWRPLFGPRPKAIFFFFSSNSSKFPKSQKRTAQSRGKLEQTSHSVRQGSRCRPPFCFSSSFLFVEGLVSRRVRRT